jgi:hypothetical protein
VGGGWGTFLSSTENLKAGPWSNGQAMVHGTRTLGVAYYQGVAIMAGGYNGNYSGLAERLNICWVSKIMLPIMKR